MPTKSTVAYATKEEVPYHRDDKFPTFRGAQGAVYRATRSYGMYNTRAFAIKEIHLRSGLEHKRLENEIKHLRKCDHPNVLKLHEAFTIEDASWTDTCFLVTEPWADASLDRFFRDLGSSQDGTSPSCSWYRPGELDPWPSIVNQCIAGIQHLHKNAVRHKDLKPSNILMVDESDNEKGVTRVKIIIADLGISKSATSGAPTSFDGTKLYMAPEQLARESSSTKSDIFSLGTCFAMIQAALCTKAGRRYWMSAKQDQAGFFAVDKKAEGIVAENIDTVLKILEQLCAEEQTRAHPSKSHFHRTLQAMIQKMFTRVPTQRPSADDLLTECQNEFQSSQDGASPFIHVYVATGRLWQSSNLHRVMWSDSMSDADFIREIRSRIEESSPKLLGIPILFYSKINNVRWAHVHANKNYIVFETKRRTTRATLLAEGIYDDMIRHLLESPEHVFHASNRKLLDLLDQSRKPGLEAERHTGFEETYYQRRGAESPDFRGDCLYIDHSVDPYLPQNLLLFVVLFSPIILSYSIFTNSGSVFERLIYVIVMTLFSVLVFLNRPGRTDGGPRGAHLLYDRTGFLGAGITTREDNQSDGAG